MFVEAGGQRLEYADIPGNDPPFLLLHEGLGSASMWRDFPQELAAATGSPVVAYSRARFGQSSPRSRPYGKRCIHAEAEGVIVAVRQRPGLAPPGTTGPR